MNQALGLRILGEIMDWDEDRAMKEFAWLRLMSRLKYDGYRDFIAGMRFVESLAAWLQQFKPQEREIAYSFVRNSLVYIGPAEIQHLVELFYPETVQRRLLSAVADSLNISKHRVWADANAAKKYEILLRQSLFFGMSDGARIDTFRRTNAGTVSNEQVLLATEISDEKWDQVLKDLRKDLKDKNARFAFILLIDDFVGSGTTLLRKEDGSWNGRLKRFWDTIEKHLSTHVQDDWSLIIHHYIGNSDAIKTIKDRQKAIAAERDQYNWYRHLWRIGILRRILPPRRRTWFKSVEFTFGTILPPTLRVSTEHHKEFLELVTKYYNSAIQTSHTAKGGNDVRLGFGSCGLPLVLEHNTPNNSIALIWAETDDANGQHAMRPLFRRRQRHS